MRKLAEAPGGTLVLEKRREPRGRSLIDYVTVLKPRETFLLTFIGVAAAIVAGQGTVPVHTLLLALAAIGLGSAGANGLTNYLDRNVDARMRRTHLRALPDERIVPAGKAFVWSLFLVMAALAIAWFLDPLAFVFGLTGTIAASVFRKRVMCVVQGGIAGCAPVLIGYVAVTHQLDITVLFMAILIVIWIPLHVWSVMVANREDYLQAGVVYFPVTWKPADAIKVLMVLSVLLYAAAIGLWVAGNFGWLYFAMANVLSIAMVYASFRLLKSGARSDAWKVYKLSAFPYLGLIFVALCLNFWV